MKKWLALYIGGQKWSIYLVSPKSKYLGETELAGLCDYNSSKIYISNKLDEQNREDTLLHELMHALLYVTSASKAFSSPDRTEDEADKIEEAFILSMVPTMHRLLKDMGFGFPKLPAKT